jgi:hypothetical protein
MSEGERVGAWSDFTTMAIAVAGDTMALGYSARETAEIVSGKIGVQALDNARWMIAVGLSREEARNYLDAQYKLVASWQQPERPATFGRCSSCP